MIQAASAYGNVVVALNSDAWLMRKKGYIFMPFVERAEIISAIKWVTEVIPADDSDETVCETIRKYRPDYFGNGGDRKLANTPEVILCEELGIELVWNLGGGKIQSSSELAAKMNMRKK